MKLTFAPFLRSTLLLLLLLCCLPGRAQTSTPDYVEVYHPAINQAELSIVQQDYQAALAQYQQAFAAVPAAFARDYYNAAVCALLAKDEKQTFEYLDQLVLKGVSLEYLERQPVLDSLQETRQWRRFARKYPKRRRAFRQAADLDLRADLDELYARDQYFRQAAGSWRVYGDTIQKIEDANVKNLLAWIERHGYPGEQLVGVADTLEQLPRYTIVIQRQTKAKKGHDFTPILTQAVHDGKLSPQAAAYLMDQQLGENKYKSRAFVKVNCDKPEECEGDEKLPDIQKLLVPHLSEQEQQQADARRATLGLEPLAAYRSKIRYGARDPRFKLGYEWSVANYYVPSKEAAKVLIENLMAAE